MRSSRALAALALLALPGGALAGACCVGSISSTPARVGECEHAVAALTASGEHSSGRWDRDGAVQDSSVTERALLATAAFGVRIDRQWQVGGTLPVRLNHHESREQSGWGGGVGDARALVMWDPLEEKPRLASLKATPVPIATLGVRVPTGRDWTRSERALGEDVTGLQPAAVLAGIAVERTLDRWPWSAGIATEVGVAPDSVQPAFVASASLGRTLTPRWTLTGTARHELAWATLEANTPAIRDTTAGAQLVHGRPLGWRAWVGAESAVPIPQFGASASRVASVFTGAALVR